MTAVYLTVLTALASCSEPAKRPARDHAAVMKVVEKYDGFFLMEGNEKVLFYNRKPTRFSDKLMVDKDNPADQTLVGLLKMYDNKAMSNYVHPLYGLDGEVLTEDFPLDHLHQHGIFWAWHQIFIGEKKMGDGWLGEKFSTEVYGVDMADDSNSAAIKIHASWKSPSWKDDKGKEKPFVKETTTIRAYRKAENIRKIDFEIQLLALEDGVKIGGSNDEKGYGGFAPRIRLPKDMVFAGKDGPVKPTNTPIDAGPWMDFSGHFNADGQISGMAVLCHNSIPGYPRPWILRQKESMQNAVFPGKEQFSISREKPLILRYRLILHKGSITNMLLDKLQEEYNSVSEGK